MERRLRDLRATEVPFRHQSFDFTSGPACLLMAMRHFDPSLEVTREREVDLWREANLLEASASKKAAARPKG
ncbi:MAG TPA: peptidase C39 family protein [Thermoplasmata archaeon]